MSSGEASLTFTTRRAVVAVVAALCLAPSGAAVSAFAQGETDNAVYTVDPQRGAPRNRFMATLRNLGTSTIETGRDFAIARLTPDGWRRLRHGRSCAWPADARIIRPGDSYTQRIGLLGSECRFKALDPGRYRVVKSIRFTGGVSSSYREATVRAPFRVVRG